MSASTARPTRDHGFTLVEVVVAMATFSVLVAFTAALALRINSTARQNDLRVTAASLANRQIESVRGQDISQIPDGLQVSTKTVGAIPYTVRQTAQLTSAGATASLCGSTSNTLAYKLVTVTVSWPSMGSVPAVRADTLKVVGTNALDSTKGTVAVQVARASGSPTADVAVTLAPSGATVVTGDDGCAVFSQVDAGTYTATATLAGHVSAMNVATSSASSIGVTAGQVAHADLLYDESASFTVTPAGPATSTMPAGVPLMLRSTYVTDTQLPGCGTGSGCATDFPGQVQNLFPTLYSMWAGACHDAKTAASMVNVDLASAAVRGSTVQLPMAQATVDVLVGGVSTPGRTLYAIHAPDAASTPPPMCASGATYTLPVSQAGGIGVLLPHGAWTFSTSPSGSGGVTVTLSDTPASITLTETS